MILTVELYSRASNIVSHCGPTDFSVPPSSLDFSCGVYNKSDGGVEKAKLIIGTGTINLLVTASVEKSKDLTVHIGPGVEFHNSRISLNSLMIFVRNTEQDCFIKHFSNSSFKADPLALNISHLRQVATGFNKVCTYNPWRRSLDGFNTTLLTPVTVFTLCSLPTEQGFGFSSSLVVISSRTAFKKKAFDTRRTCQMDIEGRTLDMAFDKF